MCHCHPCIFPCVFLNLWSQEKISPYRKTTFLLLKFKGFTTFTCLLIVSCFFIQINGFLTKSGPYGPGPCGILIIPSPE